MIEDKEIDELVDLVKSLGKKKKQVVKLTKQHSLPSRGLKLCPSCKKYCGVRSFLCQCGYEFPTAEKKEKIVDNSFDEPPISDEDKRYIGVITGGVGGTQIFVGAGQCPAALNGLDRNSVFTFCDKVVAAGLQKKKVYMPSVIKNWVSHIISRDDPDYKVVTELIDLWYDEKVSSTMTEE
jgi:hypothetical protein